MTAKHTPGPWSVGGPSDSPWVWSAGMEIVPHTMADARLIAAAPDMHALLLRLAHSNSTFESREVLCREAGDLLARIGGES